MGNAAEETKETAGGGRSFLQKVLDGVEKAGNKVPHPAVIFLWLMALVAVLSHILYKMGISVTYKAVNPDTDQIESITATVQSLLTADGIRHIFTTTISSFSGFGPLAIILVVMVGVGLAEESGLIGALIHKLIAITPKWAVTLVWCFSACCRASLRTPAIWC